jgi:endo-1,4-beta-xylanase
MRWNVRRRKPAETIGLGAVVLAVVAAPVAGIAIASASAAPAPTTVLSANFDDSALDGLQQSGSPTLSYVDNGAGKALSIAGRVNSWDTVQVPSGLLAPGTTYNLSMKVELAAGAPDTTAHFTQNVDGTYGWVGTTTVTAGSFTTITGTFAVPSTATTVGLSIEADKPTGGTLPDFLVDDVSITAPSASTDAALVSSDFESGVAPWTPHGTATLGQSTDAHAGSNSLLVSGRAATWNGTQVDLTSQTAEGGTYTFDAWVKRPADTPAGTTIKITADTKDGSATEAWNGVASADNVDASGWVELTGTWTRPAGLTSVIFYFEAGDTGSFLVDDVTIVGPPSQAASVQDITPIKDTLDFPVGAAVSDPQLLDPAGQLLAKHFDQVTPENTMKPEAWYNADHSFVTTNTSADNLMTFAQKNNLRVYGHTLVWYQQTPAWFFQDDTGRDLTNSPTDQQFMRDRLKAHINNVAKYLSDKYGKFGSATNKLVSFDVVNEVVADDNASADGLRDSRWHQILGAEYIADAFTYANAAFNGTYADPTVSHPVALFINDYSTEQSGKRTRLLNLVDSLISKRVPVDGVGHQFHVTMTTPVSTLKDAIDAFNGKTSAGHALYQAVTELDVPTGTPVTLANKIDQGYYYKDVYDMLRAEAKPKANGGSGASIFSVTVWGLLDGQSWRSGEGAPLIFDDRLQAKPAYYGITDQTLPDKIRTATVFQGDVTGTGQTSSVEWSKLPLLSIDANTQFQLRWAPDHLTAYVAVTDSTSDATDAVTFKYGDGVTATVKRDGTVSGTGVTAEAVSTSAGWKVVAHLPESPALSEGGSTQFDVAVTNGATTTGWNTGTALGSLTLVEPLSYTEIPQATTAPAIDGVKDPVWDTSSSVVTSKGIVVPSDGSTGAKATVHQLWKDNYLYIFAEVTDATIDSGSPNPWEQDSIEIFTDPGNAKNGAYRTSDAQMRIGADGAVSFGGGDTEAAQKARLTSAAKTVPGGYVVEARIDLLAGNTGVGKFEGVDYEVNDGTGVTRTANYGWAEQTGHAYQTTSRWGVAQLVAAPTNPGGNNNGSGTGNGGGNGTGGSNGNNNGTSGQGTGPKLTLSASTVQAGGTLTVSATGATAGDAAQVVLHSSPVVLATGKVAADGTFTVKVRIPSSTPAGQHTIELALPGGSVTVPLTVTAADPSSLASTGSDVRAIALVAVLALLLGGLAVVVRRASRRHG